MTPFFKEKELQRRLTDFEKNNNVKEFMYETPFTKGGKARGEIDEQYKRRTVLMSKWVLKPKTDPCQNDEFTSVFLAQKFWLTFSGIHDFMALTVIL